MKNGDLFAKQKAQKAEKAQKVEKKSKSKKEKADDKSKAAKDWENDETCLLIELLEVNPCLWDIYHKDYKKRDISLFLSPFYPITCFPSAWLFIIGLN